MVACQMYDRGKKEVDSFGEVGIYTCLGIFPPPLSKLLVAIGAHRVVKLVFHPFSGNHSPRHLQHACQRYRGEKAVGSCNLYQNHLFFFPVPFKKAHFIAAKVV